MIEQFIMGKHERLLMKQIGGRELEGQWNGKPECLRDLFCRSVYKTVVKLLHAVQN